MELTAADAIAHIVNTERYPLLDPGSPALQAVVDRARRELADVGCTVLQDFVKPSVVAGLRAESAELAPRAHFAPETVNVYNQDADPGLPAEHPGTITMQRGNAFVARDLIPPGSLLQRLYDAEPFHRLVAECFQLPQVYQLADPLAGLCLNVLLPGKSHPWHFDLNEYTVSLLTQEPVSGGVFEYSPNIRTPESENFVDVRAVVTGNGDHLLRRLALRPGDVQLFRGRYSVHQVSTVEGELPRYTAIFAFTERPGVIGGPVRTQQLFGRVLPVHEAEAGVRSDALLD